MLTQTLTPRPTTHLGSVCIACNGEAFCEAFCEEAPTLRTFRELYDYQRFCGTGRTLEEEHAMLDVLIGLDDETLRRILIAKLEERDYYSASASRRIMSVITMIASIFAERGLVFDTRDWRLCPLKYMYWPEAVDVIIQPQ